RRDARLAKTDTDTIRLATHRARGLNRGNGLSRNSAPETGDPGRAQRGLVGRPIGVPVSDGDHLEPSVHESRPDVGVPMEILSVELTEWSCHSASFDVDPGVAEAR